MLEVMLGFIIGNDSVNISVNTWLLFVVHSNALVTICKQAGTSAAVSMGVQAGLMLYWCKSLSQLRVQSLVISLFHFPIPIWSLGLSLFVSVCMHACVPACRSVNTKLHRSYTKHIYERKT